MSTISRLSDVYDKGGIKAVGRSILDFIHYDVSNPWARTTDIVNPSKYYEINSDGLIPVHLPGYTLYLDPDDPGISTEIMKQGIRESASYWTYRQELGNLPTDPIIVEIGANIGYYAIAAAIDCPDATILCAELDKENIDRLKYNAEKNNVLNQMHIKNVAISDRTEIRSATLTRESNRHTLQSDRSGENTTTEHINCITGDEFLSEYGINAPDVDCIRMDVEGHETYVLEGFNNLSPKLAHIEVHPHLLDANEWSKLIDTLRSWNLDISTVAKGPHHYSINRVEDIPVNRAHQVVLVDNKSN